MSSLPSPLATVDAMARLVVLVPAKGEPVRYVSSRRNSDPFLTTDRSQAYRFTKAQADATAKRLGHAYVTFADA